MAYERIMIVDDSSTSRMIIKRCFCIAGYEKSQYFEAEDGLAALNLLKDQQVDLIVSDLNMPRMDGATFIRRLKMKEDMSQIPVLVISSIGNDKVKDDLAGPNLLAVIRKPLSPTKVLDALGEGEVDEDEF